MSNIRYTREEIEKMANHLYDLMDEQRRSSVSRGEYNGRLLELLDDEGTMDYLVRKYGRKVIGEEDE